MALPADSPKQAMIREAKRLIESMTYTSKGHFNTETVWSRAHLWLGLAATIAAAVSGAVHAAPVEDWIQLVVAGLGTVLVAAVTFLNPERRAVRSRQVAVGLQNHLERMRRWMEIDLPGLSVPVARKDFEEMAATRNKVLEEAPPILSMAYRKAKKGIEAGEADHAVDVE